MAARFCLTLTESYELEQTVHRFLAERRRDLSAEPPGRGQPVLVDLVGLQDDDPRLAPMQGAAGALDLRLRWC